jgi:hypothetical protein
VNDNNSITLKMILVTLVIGNTKIMIKVESIFEKEFSPALSTE